MKKALKRATPSRKVIVKILVVLAGLGLLLTTFLPFIPFILLHF